MEASPPEIFPGEIISAGITTVVGCLGVDTTTKTMPALLARAKALGEEGLTALGTDADVLVLHKGSLEIREVMTRVRLMMRGGQVVVNEGFLKDSNRIISLAGNKSDGE